MKIFIDSRAEEGQGQWGLATIFLSVGEMKILRMVILECIECLVLDDIEKFTGFRLDEARALMDRLNHATEETRKNQGDAWSLEKGEACLKVDADDILFLLICLEYVCARLDDSDFLMRVGASRSKAFRYIDEMHSIPLEAAAFSRIFPSHVIIAKKKLELNKFQSLHPASPVNALPAPLGRIPHGVIPEASFIADSMEMLDPGYARVIRSAGFHDIQPAVSTGFMVQDHWSRELHVRVNAFLFSWSRQNSLEGAPPSAQRTITFIQIEMGPIDEDVATAHFYSRGKLDENEVLFFGNLFARGLLPKSIAEENVPRHR